MAPLLPTLAAHARNILSSALGPSDFSLHSRSVSGSSTIDEIGPLAARALLTARDSQQSVNPSVGVTPPQSINNNAIFALFGLIGVAFVAAGIWFFFWAKNGGFYFRETDWDDYKTTVLRRRGPNGTLLSNATPSTNLGGGSVYKDVDDGSTEYTGAQTHSRLGTDDSQSTFTGITGGVSTAHEKRRVKREKKERREREREKRQEEKAEEKRRRRQRRKVGADGALVDEEAEADAKQHLREYRHEKPARVGGLNKESEGSQWDGSTNPAESTAASELLSHRQSTPTGTPTGTPTKSGADKKTPAGIRKVYSAADRNADREHERIRSEAKRLADKGRAAGAGSSRRDFSFRAGIEEESAVGRSEASSQYVPGSWAESDAGSEVGTKSYRHVIPGLSSSAGGSSNEYAEEKRKKRGGAGYRRGRGDGYGEDGR